MARPLLIRISNRAVKVWVSLLPDHPMPIARFFSARIGLEVVDSLLERELLSLGDYPNPPVEVRAGRGIL